MASSVGHGQSLGLDTKAPHLVAPTPVYAAPFSLTQHDSNRSGQSSSINSEGGQVNQPAKQPTTSHLPSSLRASNDASAILPIRGGDEEAAAAVEKLERLKKANQSKNIWRRGSGLEGFSKSTSTGAKKGTKEEGVEEESSDFVPRFGEVKLGISSLPGYHVLAAQKAKMHLGRSNTVINVAQDAKAMTSSESMAEEEGSMRTNFSFRRSNNQLLKRKATSGGPKMDGADISEGSLKAQTDTPPSLPSPGEDTLARSRSMAPNPDLTSVKEERRNEEVADAAPKRAPLSIITSGTTSSQTREGRGPRLMVQSPSENGLIKSAEEVPNRSGFTGTPFSSHSASVMSSQSETEEGNKDADAVATAEACQQSSSRISAVMAESPISSTSTSGDEEGSASDSEGSDLNAMQQEEYLLNLQHGQELTKKEKKRLLRRMRRSIPAQPSGEAVEARGETQAANRQHRRKGSLSNKVQLGLHYASSQSRNRRAMERYSPHPSRPSSTAPLGAAAKTDSSGNLADLLASARASQLPLQSLADISRSSTPALRDAGAGSRRSSMSEKDGMMTSGAGTNGELCLSPTAESATDREDRWTDLSRYIPRRQGTNSSIASSTAHPSFRKKYLNLLRRKENPSDVVEESDSGRNTPKDDGEGELDKVLGKLVAQQAPDLLQERYEYDVLYENQRGLMVFGIPKFSAKTLFQWDPAPWTNAQNGNSAYNIVNAQLPDPSWEWIHAEWLIDMSGDVDEAGWQYGYNFGRFTFATIARPFQPMPRANRQDNETMNRRMEARQAREERQEDDGFEALKRTARNRGAKWTGMPTQNTYVRRRRWIRLRRRKALPFSGTAANTPATGTPLGLSKASGDWSNLVEEERKKREKQEAEASAHKDGTLSSSDDETLSDLESDETDSVLGYASDDAGSSDFLPRRTPGNLANGPDAKELRAGKELDRQRRHARDFSGTVRELKTLLPAILDRRSHNRGGSAQEKRDGELWLRDLDARNPFISWSLVKKRLDDDDLAFATTSLRARERRSAQKKEGRARGAVEEERVDEGERLQPREQSFDLTKDALVEINFRRVMRVMKACKVDRQKLQLWKIWLGVDPASSITEVAREEEEFAYAGLGINSALTSEGLGGGTRESAEKRARGRWKRASSMPDGTDVWDLLERRLDRLLLTFEYQGSRASLLRLLLTLHATSHPSHRFRQGHWSVENQAAEPLPSTLSPDFGSREVWKVDVGEAAPAGDEWRAVKLPRLEFWSDLEKCARAVVHSSPGMEQASPPVNSVSPPLAALSRTSPAPSTIRSHTPQPVSGSLANGPPTARRFSHTLGQSPPMGPLWRASSSTATSRRLGSPASMGDEKGDRDRSFLAELLQLPAQTQKDLLVKTAGAEQPSLAPSSRNGSPSRGEELDGK